MSEIAVELRRRKRLRGAGEYIVTGVEVYPSGTVVVNRKADYNQSGEDKKRSEIKEFSRASRERLAIVSRETIIGFSSMLTLSYGKQFPLNGKEVKQHLNRFLSWYRRDVGGNYIWWLEFQERGAPHIHLASHKDNPRWFDREECADRWARAQGLTYGLYYSDLATREERNLYDDVFAVHKHPSQWQAAKKEDGPKRYILKYALKMRQKIVPKRYRNVGRFWGCSKGVRASVPDPKVIEMSEAGLRDILAKSDHIAQDWECIPKNIWGIDQKFWE